VPSPPPNAASQAKFPPSELHRLEKAIRRIVRSHDLQSKALTKACGLTSAQLVLMKGMAVLGEVTSAALSSYADISAATVVTVLDNLEERGLIQRYRSGNDRRVVHTRLTETGRALLSSAPPPLGQAFVDRLAALDPDARRHMVEQIAVLSDLLLPPAEPRVVPKVEVSS
jgi:DNA-binding MarR family transcriptional regulator